jgi:hypothetical protein
MRASRIEVTASSSFLKKRTKKLLLIGVRRGSTVRPNLQKFLLPFSKRSAFLRPAHHPNAGIFSQA